MDDILLAHKDRATLQEILTQTVLALEEHGLKIAPEKIQTEPSFSYLGRILHTSTITHQPLQLRKDHLNTLNDYQKLLGDINWVRSYLKITTLDLKPLFDILKGDSNPKSPRQLTVEGEKAIAKIEQAINKQQLQYLDYSKSWALIILATKYTPTGCLWQEGPLEWIHLPVTPRKIVPSYPSLVATLIIKGRRRSIELFGREVTEIIIPYKREQLDTLLQFEEEWQIAIDTHVQQTLETSAQRTELLAVIYAFEQLQQVPFNLYTDSQYIVKLFPHIETASLPQGRTAIFSLLTQLQTYIHKREKAFYIGHIRAHSCLPGPLSEGNYQADLLTRPVVCTALEEARRSHAIHHQNASALRLYYRISREAARSIVRDCGHCPTHFPSPATGVNPRGLRPCDLWQMDITHVPSFGKLCYVHVCIDTFSHVILASARTGEAFKDVSQHLFQCFSYLGIPRALKTDNGPAYTSRAFKNLCSTFGIAHTTGIPYNPQGQAIVERAHQTLKTQIKKLQENEFKYSSPHHVLQHTLFVINILNVDSEENSPMYRHWNPDLTKPKALVKKKNPKCYCCITSFSIYYLKM
ncbi:PREDICTED: endogenous retrovirus group K member 6 Pol protein-like [Myotis brandtii]|uniref:endogenous retrovirus group K member 6 Pol protein-like n=1 Tax=Myotis brandtii TaxID=109478 RepID=UPI00070452FF|nr:PREDICTED: endogenous retrovirus group K member 6 Pol protein-like [Myotis brandtii]